MLTSSNDTVSSMGMKDREEIDTIGAVPPRPGSIPGMPGMPCMPIGCTGTDASPIIINQLIYEEMKNGL
jgi:hypothetical protein